MWVISISTEKARQVTNTPGTESGGYWSHDGRYLAYFRQSEIDNSSGVWLYDFGNKSEQEVLHFPDRKMDILTKIIWHQDDSAIYFYDEIGFVKLDLSNKTLSYLFDNDNQRSLKILHNISFGLDNLTCPITGLRNTTQNSCVFNYFFKRLLIVNE